MAKLRRLPAATEVRWLRGYLDLRKPAALAYPTDAPFGSGPAV